MFLEASLVHVDAVIAPDPEPFGMMHVGAPVREGDGVVVDDTLVVILLAHHVIADESPALADTGHVVQPEKFPPEVLLTGSGIVVLGVVPQAQRDAEQFIADVLGVFDRVLHPAVLHPPGVMDMAVDVIAW